MKILKGKKTYILAGLAIACVVAHTAGFLDVEAYQTIMTILGFGSIATLRASVSKK